MGPEFVAELSDVMTAIETDDQLKVVVFDSAVEGSFLNRGDCALPREDTASPRRATRELEAWRYMLARITHAPVVSIAKIRGRATGHGSDIALACDMCFASREKALLSQWEVGVGMAPADEPMARLLRLVGRARALEVLMSSDDARGDLAAAYCSINRSL